MKIVCDSCQAKYSIADEKVAGKVFKIRCKRCGTTIVVRGDEGGPPAGAAGGIAGEAIWHVVVNGEQHGPYEPAQLAEMLTAGTVDWEAYVWCEGFENWVPMRDVEDLVAQITGQGQKAQPAQRVSAVSYSAPPSMGADPFADDAHGAPSPFDAPGAMDAGPDLFGPGSHSGRFEQSSPSAVAAAPLPNAGDQPMTGARNENSVLFSLKNLQALATGSSPSNPPPAAAPAGFATGEGSGLIDIRKLASATGVGEGDGAGEKDDLLSIGAQGGAFGALGSPMLAATADEGDSHRKAIIWAGVAATAFLSVAAIAIVYILRPQAAPPPQQVVTVPVPVAPAPAPGAVGAPAPAQGAVAAPAPAPSGAEAAAAKPGATAAPAEGGEATRRKRAAGGGAKGVARGDEDLLGGGKQEPEAKPAAPRGPRSIDDLLDSALEGKSTSKSAGGGQSAGPALPDNPSRDDILRGMNGVKGAVQSCAQGQGGVAIVNVTVAGATGRVTSAQVEGITGPAGSCIAREVRKASFPKFKNATFKVKYPYRL